MDTQGLKYIHNKWFLPEESGPNWLLPCIGIALLALIVALIIRKVGLRAHGLDT